MEPIGGSKHDRTRSANRTSPVWNSVQFEQQLEAIVHRCHVLEAEVAYAVPELAGVNRANHLAEHLRFLAIEFHLGMEGGVLRRLRSWAYSDSRKGHEVICLDNHGVATTVLNPSSAAWEVDLVDVTTDH